jgi:hypothetical protein
MDKFAQNILPARYFGEVIDGSSLPTGLTLSDGLITIGSGYTGKPIHTMDEGDFEKSGHLFAGDVLATGDKFAPGKAYVEDEDIICKVITKDTIKYMAAFETATDFFNPQSLTTSKMLIWGFSEPARVLGEPCVVIHAD